MKNLSVYLSACVIVCALILVVFFTARFFEKLRYPVLYGDIIEKYAGEFGIDPYILYAIIKCESGFDKDAVSGADAYGLMQLLPDTYEWLTYRTQEEFDPQLLFDPQTNIRYGAMLMRYLLDRYDGNLTLAHAAYNAGWGRVDDWIKNPEYFRDGELIRVPIRETETYLKCIERASERYQSILKEKNR